MPPTKRMKKTIELNQEEAAIIAGVLQAGANGWRRYSGMNWGSSTIHNISSDELSLMYDLADKLNEQWDNKLF